MILALGIALSALLASCHDDNGTGRNSCGNATPVESSRGVVAADFNGDGFSDVVALSAVHPPAAPASHITTCVSTAAGAFAAPARRRMDSTLCS
jgi:hypothetical protein